MSTFMIASTAFAVMFAIDKISTFFMQGARQTSAMVAPNSRWFLIHSLTNIYITCCCSHDLYLCLTDPETALTISNPSTYNAFIVSLVLHFYHTVVFYSHLTKADVLHHAAMCGICGPLTAPHVSRLTGAGLWFITGFPGAVDYCLLWLVKMGAFDRMREKQAYVLISAWIRSPGCCFCFYLSLLRVRSMEYNWLSVVTLINGIMLFWNGQYYCMISTRDYGTKLQQQFEIEKTEKNRSILQS